MNWLPQQSVAQAGSPAQESVGASQGEAHVSPKNMTSEAATVYPLWPLLRQWHWAACRILSGGLLLLLVRSLAANAQFDYQRNEQGSNTITRYQCTPGAITIPGTIDGLPVTHIGGEAFSGCTGLTNVNFQGDAPIRVTRDSPETSP